MLYIKEHYDNLDELMPLLQRVDNGYAPTTEELRKLSKITDANGLMDETIKIVPNAISLLTSLRTLDLSFSEIEDISALSSLPLLQELDLDNTNVSNIEALSSLTDLQVLSLADTKVADIEVLANLTSLHQLDLSSTDVKNISSLSSLIDLCILDLNNSNIENIDVLAELPNLIKLNLHNTAVSDVYALSNLFKLVELDLSHTFISDISALSGLVELQGLDISDTQTTNISALSRLTKLQVLDISNTQITNIDVLSCLSNLQILSMRETMIEDISVLSRLINIRELNCGGSPITTVAPLSGLKSLEDLYLWQTPLTSIRELSELTNLTTLSIWGTQVTNIDAVRNMKQLQWLDISDTPVHSLPRCLGELNNIQKIDLSRLHLHSIPKEIMKLGIPFQFEEISFYETGIVLAQTTLTTQPISLFDQPRELIEAYFNATQIPVNEAKVIFLGDGGAGKTHTIQRIHNDGKKDTYETETTPGIDITNYTAVQNGRNFNIHFWDFGGQEIMHAMHRCFLTDRTCYVVVVSNRWDLNTRARYWLKNIDSFAKGAPVILAINQWDNIQENGIDMNRLSNDYPNLVKQPIYYSAKDSSESEFQFLVDAIIREAGKLDSTAMDFPAQWAAIRQELLDIAEIRHYIDKQEYHAICDRQRLDSLQIRTWLLEWFNDLGVCFSYHQDTTEKSEMVSYKVLNPRWLTNAIYIIINAGKRYADKGLMHLNLIQDLLEHSEFGVLPGITYTENERDYVLDVMRKFNLSYSVSSDQEFIPALCDSETPQDLHPAEYVKRVSYQIKYSYLPDSVIHQLMIRSYKNLNPDKIWRKGLRIDIQWLGLSAVVDMGDDDSTLRIDVYSNGAVEPWKLLLNVRKEISSINSGLGLKAKDYIIIHEESEDIAKTVNELLDAKDQGLNPLPIYNERTGKWRQYQIDNLLGMTFGEELMGKTEEMARKDNCSFSEAFHSINIGTLNIINSTEQPNAHKILEYLIRNQCETSQKLLDCFVDAFESAQHEDARRLAVEVKTAHKEKQNFLKRIEERIKPAATIVSSGTTLYNGGKAIVAAIQAAYPKIVEILPEIAEAIQQLPPAM